MEQGQQKYTVWVDEYLVKDAPHHPQGKRRSVHECYAPIGLSIVDVAKNVDDQINKTYLDENPPEVREIQVIGILATDEDKHLDVDVEVRATFMRVIDKMIEHLSKEPYLTGETLTNKILKDHDWNQLIKQSEGYGAYKKMLELKEELNKTTGK